MPDAVAPQANRAAQAASKRTVLIRPRKGASDRHVGINI